MDNGKVSAVLWKDGVASSILASATTASVVELVDTRVLETRAHRACRFDSCQRHQLENNFPQGSKLCPYHIGKCTGSWPPVSGFDSQWTPQ